MGPPSAAASVLHGLLFSPLLPAHLRAGFLNGVSIGGPVRGRPFMAPSFGLGVMLDPQNPLGLVVGHTGQGPGSTAAVYSAPSFVTPRTFAAFTGADSVEALGSMETHVLNRLRAAAIG